MAWFNHEPIDPNILANIKVPVLILAGELDEVCPNPLSGPSTTPACLAPSAPC